MTAPALLDTLKERGVLIRAEAGALKLRPAELLDAEVLAEVRRHKAELLAKLEPAPQSEPASELAPERPALAAFLAAVEAHKVKHGLVSMTHDLLKLWRVAEEEAGHALTLSGSERLGAARSRAASIRRGAMLL